MMTPKQDTRTTRSAHNLPAEIAPLIGRASELVEIERTLASARLLTITGAGGSGKTRLALRVAADLASRYADGAWFVSFAPIDDTAQLPRAIASALGARAPSGRRSLLASLTDALASRRLLLVLDNCEHVIGGAARVAETLLRACPRLQILATSREPLRVSGEVMWRTPALALPPEPLPTLEVLAQVESVALFLDRARARQRDFILTMRNAPAIAAICRQLDGLPLGIELAAAHVGALTPEQIAARLDDALRLLGGGSRTIPRQETLRATLDWSHALLTEAERTLFRRLAVFGGGFDLDAVEGVCDDGDDGEAGGRPNTESALTVLLALAEKSLVEPHIEPGMESRGARYRLLEPVRQYAWERLIERGELDDLRRGHACYYLLLAEAAEPKLMSGDRADAMERLAADYDNLRIALAWGCAQTSPEGSEISLRLASALMWYWNLRGEVSEGLEWIEAALAKGREASPAARAKALHLAGELTWLQGYYPLARARLEEAAELCRTLGAARELAYVLQALALLVEREQASAMAEESLRLFEGVGDPWGAAHAQLSLATIAFLSGDDDTGDVGLALLREALARWRAVGDEWGMAQTLNYMGDVMRSHGDLAGARASYQEALALLRRQNLTGSVPSLLHNLGYLGLRSGEPRKALRLFRESLGLF
ncbi:MAG TPA: AAA family ATPase, partial [Ktedonobacterales bacterium]|nr:AAA family ATPase [Ktedonobacterales bacterium]